MINIENGSVVNAEVHNGHSLLDRTLYLLIFFFSSRRRHTRLQGDWSSDVCSSDLFVQICETMTKYTTKLNERRDVAEGTMAFHLEKPPGFQFKAGQYMNVTLIDPQIGRASCRGRV